MPDIRIHDAVEFAASGEQQSGYVASLTPKKAHVVVDHQTEFNVPIKLLKRKQDTPPKRVFTHTQMIRCRFAENQLVTFTTSDATEIEGVITNINQTRARVKTDDGFWDVGYARLRVKNNNDDARANLEKLVTTGDWADSLLHKHKLSEWRFCFDNAKRRGGSCRFSDRLITMSEQFCLKADLELIEDTILHEIAHALVGPDHQHDAVWQAKAREIGCSAQRTHCLSFSSPKYIAGCQRCRKFGVRNKRNSGYVCKTCRGPIVYQHYSDELWESCQAQVATQDG